MPKKKPELDWKCPKCGSLETFHRYRRLYEDQEIFASAMPKLREEKLEFHCRDCGHVEPIYNEQEVKETIKELKKLRRNMGKELRTQTGIDEEIAKLENIINNDRRL